MSGGLDSFGKSVDPGSIRPGATLRIKAAWQTEYFVATEVSVNNPGEVVLTGVLEIVSGNLIRVANTELKLNEGMVMPAACAGQIVVALGRFDQDGGMTALSVEAQPALQFFGVIAGIVTVGEHECSLQVASRTVKVTDADTVIEAGKAKLGLGDLKPGQFAYVYGEISDNSVLAKKILIFDPTDVMIAGTLSAFDSQSIAVGMAAGTVGLRTNSQTKVVGTLARDANVGVRGTLNNNGSILANRIEVSEAAALETRPALVRGIVDTISGPKLVVGGGMVIMVNTGTVIVSKGKTIALADIKVGDQVVAVGTKQTDGSVLATKIEVTPPAPVIIIVRGAITGIGSSFFMVGSDGVVVNGQTIIVSKGRALGFSGLTVGSQVTVAGTRQTNGSVLALKIEVIPPEPVMSTIRGVVSGIGNDYFMVGLDKVKVNQQTVVVSKGSPYGFSSLKVGDQVTAVGTRQADGALLASKIEVTPAAPVVTTVRGPVTSLGASSFTVVGIKVTINAQTVIVSKGSTLSFSNIKIGDMVTAVGTKQADGSILATKVEVTMAVPVVTTIRGAINSLGASYFMVGSTKIVVNSLTVIVSKGKILKFPDLKVGTQISATGTKQAEGSILAIKIEVSSGT